MIPLRERSRAFEVVVVIADAFEMLFFPANVQYHRNFALLHSG
jgi:hypothetical protein